MLRIRTIELEGGQKVRVSELTTGQVRALLQNFADKTADSAVWPKQVICDSFNNIIKLEKSSEPLWTPERVEEEMGSSTALQIWQTVFDVTGLKTGEAGETQAAETAASSSSAA